MAEENYKRVCVTGAGGFLASWLIKILLSHGYHVHGTLRNPDGQKNAHLKGLDNAHKNLKAFKGDLLDYNSMLAADKGCHGVFHIACPVPLGSAPNVEAEVVKPAIEGTLNVLKACSEAKVKRVVMMSSTAAICMNPKWPKDEPMDETSWSDFEHCKTTDDSGYFYAKTKAEHEAWEFARKNGLDLLTVCPSIVVGPMLQPTINTSSLFLVFLLKGGLEEMGDGLQRVVDVRDVAEAMKVVYEKAEAEGRYICSAYSIKSRELVEMLKDLYPHYQYPQSFSEGNAWSNHKFSSEKLEKLGWKYRSLKETIMDSVESYKVAGILS